VSVVVEGLVLAAGERRLGPIDVVVVAGERVLVAGRSGSGKSLLLQALAGVRPRAVLAGRAVVDRPLGVVFARDGLELDRRVVDNVVVGDDTNATRGRALVLLERLGLGGLEARTPATLSGGQRRRVSVARALARAPATLLLDDPTAGLDPATAREVWRVIVELAGDAAVLVAAPDVDVLGPLTDRALWLGPDGATRSLSSSTLPPPFSSRPLPAVVAP
jgi:putative hydroxymethylpyrimidine transport system ATP-binding protein